MVTTMHANLQEVFRYVSEQADVEWKLFMNSEILKTLLRHPKQTLQTTSPIVD